jgi:transglutaminase-like putative cysteine protease
MLLIVAIVLSVRSLNGLGTGATMLCAMIAAKLVESRATRDWYIVIAASLFLLCAACLDRQDLWRLPFYAGGLWLLLTALRAVGSQETSERAALLARRTLRSMAYALPLALVLFLLFPRLPGGFWALPRQNQAISGLSDELSPGSISELSESDEVAMRVRFSGSLPPPEARYWRGPVMHDFDGYTWRRRRGEFARAPQLRFSGPAYHYEIALEPNNLNVLMALELPQRIDLPNTFYTGDYQLILQRPLSQTRIYSLTSYLQHQDTDSLSDFADRIDRELPKDRNPRALTLARSIRDRAASNAAFVDATLQYFHDSGFVYSRTPPLLDLDSIDDLLFNTRRGFCGHYASAFAALMRAGNVPARVVTGYLGGEWNPVGGYLTVRQSHAHAWTEVWLEGRGWVRVDPTAVVAPERLTRDIFDFMPGAARSTARLLRSVPLLGSVIQSAEALNAWWQDRVVGYDYRKQLALLASLGIANNNWRALGALLGAAVALWLLWIGWTMRDQLRPIRVDALARTWRRLEAKLAKAGYPRAAHEGPLAYAERVAAAAPVLAAPLSSLARRYASLRFGRPRRSAAASDGIRQLRRAINALRVEGTGRRRLRSTVR